MRRFTLSFAPPLSRALRFAQSPSRRETVQSQRERLSWLGLIKMALLILGILGACIGTRALEGGPFRRMFPPVDHRALHSNETGEPLFLSPLLAKGQWKLAQEKAKVDGFQFAQDVTANVESYAGYLTVNAEDCNSNLFFWYFPAEVMYLKNETFWGLIETFSLIS